MVFEPFEEVRSAREAGVALGLHALVEKIFGAFAELLGGEAAIHKSPGQEPGFGALELPQKLDRSVLGRGGAPGRFPPGTAVGMRTRTRLSIPLVRSQALTSSVRRSSGAPEGIWAS